MKFKYAYGYVRVSDSSQEELSPASQEKLLKDYAATHHIILVKIFFELGISGRNAAKRPEFQKMIGAAKSPTHPVDLILVWKFSRFARNQEESIVYKSLLKTQHNVQVLSISEPLIDGPFGSLIERIIEWMDEYYSIRLSGEVLRGMREKAEKKGYQFPPPLGYRAVGNGEPFIIDEKEFKIISYIFNQFDRQYADYTSIARSLNEQGYRTRRGHCFESRGIARILKNPFYYGLVCWNGTKFSGTHEVRITKEQFDRRMNRIEDAASRFRPSASAVPGKHWMSGLIKCGYCHASLSWSGCHSHSPGFQCYRYTKGQHKESCFLSEKILLHTLRTFFDQLSYRSTLISEYSDFSDIPDALSDSGISNTLKRTLMDCFFQEIIYDKAASTLILLLRP